MPRFIKRPYTMKDHIEELTKELGMTQRALRFAQKNTDQEFLKNQALRAEVESMVKCALIVIEGSEYESEYDGQNSAYCGFCHANLSMGDHRTDCEMVFARRNFSQRWIDEKKKAAREKERDRISRLPTTVVKCEYCGNLTQNRHMDQHQKDSKKCLEIREEEERGEDEQIVDWEDGK